MLPLLLPGGTGAAGSALTLAGPGCVEWASRQHHSSSFLLFPRSSPSPCPGLAHCRLHAGRTLLQEAYKYQELFLFSFFLVDWPIPSPCLCPPTPIPFSLCSQNYKQESQCSCRSCPSRKSVEKRLGATVLRGARLMTEPPGSSSQSMLSKLASARSRAMPPDGS